MACNPCEVARRTADDVLGRTLHVDSVHLHAIEAAPDAVGGLWGHVWIVAYEHVADVPPVELVDQLTEVADGCSAPDRHAVESGASMASADDLLRGGLIRACVDAFVNAWVAAHTD